MNQEIEFTIWGNQEDSNGNPIPYERTTQRSLWQPRDRRYYAWKEYVQRMYLKAIGSDHLNMKFDTFSHIPDPKLKKRFSNKPIKIKTKIYMDIFIRYKHNARGDNDNIWKGIADALFEDDKHVAGSFDYEVVQNSQPKVDVRIKLVN